MEQQNSIKVGICADHGGYELKEIIKSFLKENGFETIDFGANHYDKADDFPDFVIPMAKSVAKGEVFRAIAICGSGVGACVAANKINNVRAALIHDYFSAHQGVEDDDMNVICIGGRTTGFASAQEYVLAFLNAKFIGGERHVRRLNKIKLLEK